jgi:cystathionine gamma-lyase
MSIQGDGPDDDHSQMREATRVVRAGLPPSSQGDPFLPGPTFASAYHFSGEPGSSAYTYGRYHNPTWTRFEQALSELEGGPSVVFASGMAAVTAVLGIALRSNGRGNVLVMPSDGYYTARLLATGYFSMSGIETRLAPTAGDAQLKKLDGATLLWLETPCNPGLDVCDLQRIIKAAHDRGAMVAVDNTTATVLGQKPLEFGADFSISSDSKALTGHNDLTLGHVAAREESLAQELRTFRTQQGAVPGPMEVWLAHRSLATLSLRLERQCDTAQKVAEFLARRPEVSSVRYPGLVQDASFAVASRQMKHFGPIVSFVLKDKHIAEHFLESCKLVINATSFGGIHTSAERRARWGGDAIPEGFIRLSVGCEDPQDIIEDLAQALGTPC